MQNPSNQVNYALLRKGHRLNIKKVPNEFTVRTERGVDDFALSRAFGCEYVEDLNKQRLSVLAVETAERDEVMNEIRNSEGVKFASHVYAVEHDPLARIYLTDEVTIQFIPTTEISQIEELISQFGINFVKNVKGVDNCFVFRLSETATMNPLKMAVVLQEREEVAYAEANVGIKSMSYYTPSDNLFGMQWHLHNDGGIQLSDEAHVYARDAWEITRGDRSVTVAIADDSVDLDHRDFTGDGKIVAPRDFKGFDFNPSPVEPTDNHGTSCAGVAVAEENGQGVVGIAPGSSLMPIRTTGILDDNSIEALFEWAVEQGAAVISNSWGPSSVNFPLSIRQDQAISRAAREGRGGKGLVICFAAGNANRPVNGTIEEEDWPDAMLAGPTRWFNGYATHQDVITVSACTSLNLKAAYSSWGDEISLCAPSSNTHPVLGRGFTYPRIPTSFPGRGITTTDRVGPLGYSSSDYTSNFGGTSSACPLVAGVAALVIAANPALTASEVREVLEQTADKIIDNSTDQQLGVAFGNYDDRGHSRWFGYGKVNAFEAVKEARSRRGTPAVERGTLEVSAQPGVAIPDSNQDGITDLLEVEESGLLQSVAVGLHIAHTYIGDLEVSLEAPFGQCILLHNRTGGSANDLVRTYSTSDLPALDSLRGKNIKGSWKLHVKDLATQDTGTLISWTLKLDYNEMGNVIELEESPGITIPDNEPEGLLRRLSNSQAGKILDLEVEVDISHTYISDLIVELVAPSGQSLTLHNRFGGSNDNIKQTYKPDTLPLLKQLEGTLARGEWGLRIRDLAQQDTGKLNRWALRLMLE
jgi:subtilisin-like proprotein convertase family protein